MMRSINAAVLGLVVVGAVTPATRADLVYVSLGDSTIVSYDTTANPPTPTTFASTGLSLPYGLAFDASGNLYAANLNTNTIERFTPGGVASVFATGLSGPYGLAFDASGNLYAANLNSNTIERFTPGGVGSVFASTGLNRPTGLAFDAAGNLYAANYASNTIERFTPGGVASVFATTSNIPEFLAILPSAAVPEPRSLVLMGIGALMGLGYTWPKFRSTAAA